MSELHSSTVPAGKQAEEHPEQVRQSLACGFRDVDKSGDTGSCQRCLDLIAGIPFFHEIKEETVRIIAATDPALVLDAGCGAGIDLVSLAPSLSAHSRIIGLDASQSLLALAAERTSSIKERCSLVRGDITQIPCKDSVFDACRIDRVLQHLREPQIGIRELVRVIRPGGTLVAFDNDWNTFSINLDDQDTAVRICRFWRDSFASGRIGSELPGIFEKCGLVEIHAELRTLTLTDLSVAGQVFDLFVLLDRTEQTGVLTLEKIAAVRAELHRRAQEGMFSSGYNGFLVWGTKPG